MATVCLIFSRDEIHEEIPYQLVCMTRYGSLWGTIRRKYRWKMEFTDAERKAARKIFGRAHDWMLGRGIPDEVTMSMDTFYLWKKLGKFCASI